jgi:hypothetical protein
MKSKASFDQAFMQILMRGKENRYSVPDAKYDEHFEILELNPSSIV